MPRAPCSRRRPVRCSCCGRRRDVPDDRDRGRFARPLSRRWPSRSPGFGPSENADELPAHMAPVNFALTCNARTPACERGVHSSGVSVEFNGKKGNGSQAGTDRGHAGNREERQIRPPSARNPAYRLIMWPARPWKASCTASRQRRVRVHVARRLEGGEVPLLRERQLGQQLGHVGADQVAAEQLEVLAVGDELDEADRLAEAVGLAVRRERELRDLDVVAGVARLLLGETERARPAASRTSRAASCGSRRAPWSRPCRSSRPRRRPAPRRRARAAASR